MDRLGANYRPLDLGRFLNATGPISGESPARMLLLVGFNALLTLWLLVRPAPESVVNVGCGLANMVGPVLACLWCLRRPGRAARPPETPEAHAQRPVRPALILLTLATLLFAAGQVCWHGFELVQSDPPFASWVDVLYYTAYPVLLAGVALLPWRRHSALAGGRIVVDSALVVVALAAFSWYFLLGPLVQEGGGGTRGEQILALGYPACDLLALFSLLFTCSLAPDGYLRHVRGPILAGLGVLAVSDAVFAYQILHGTYRVGNVLHAGWPLGYMLLGLGASRLRLGVGDVVAGPSGAAGSAPAGAAEPNTRLPTPALPLWRTIAPPGLVLLVGALALHTHVFGAPRALAVGVDAAVVAVCALMLVRQVFATQENNRLWSRLAAAYDQLDRGHQSLAELNRRLRSSEEHYRRIVETTDEGVWMLDADDRTSYVSRRMADLLGYTPAQMAGRPVFDFTDEPGRARLAESMRKRRQGVGEQYDGRLLRRDGTEQWVQVTASPIFDPDGRYAGALGMVSDITKRREAEQTLRFQKALLESQSETSIDGILVISPEGRMLSFNGRFLEIWNIPPEVRATRRDEDSLRYVTDQLADPEAFHRQVKYLYAHPELTSRDEVRLLDGRVIDRYASPLRAADGTYFGRVWYFRDVTDQRRSQEALRHSEERFRLACRASNGVIWDSDLTTGRVERGEAVEAVFGYPPAEVEPSQRWWADRIHPDDTARVEALVGAALVGADTAIAAEYRFRRRDGSYAHVLDRAWIMRGANGRPVRLVGAMIDLTDRRRAEELDRERRGLKEAVASMEQVLGVVGHELRTPLAGIRAMSEFLMLDGAAAAKGAEFLGAINSEVVRLSDTVDDLLEAARLNSGRARWNWSTFPLARPCDEALANLRPLLEGTAVALEGSVEPAGLEMSGDADAVRRLLLNLLSNARKHTHAGHIRVRAAAHRDAAGQWVRLTIEDTGEGIAPEILARVGEPFALNAGVVGANYVKGAGLGLAICKAIVLAHGGTFAVRSEPGAGTTVEVLLRADLPGPVVAGGKTAWGAPPGSAAADPIPETQPA